MGIGPAMATKIIKENCHDLHRSMYQALTQDKWELEECKQEHSLFMESLHQRLGPLAIVGDLAKLITEDMPQYDPLCWKHDANCNSIHRSYQNPILDTCLYEVKFPEGKITELTVNIMAEFMYVQYIDGNEYFLLQVFVI